MRYAGTLALAVVLGALGLYVYFTEFQKPQEAGPEHLLADVAADAIAQVTLQRDSSIIVGRRVGDGWRLSGLRDLPGDTSIWDGIASTLAEATLDSKVADSPSDPGLYGLAHPRLKVTATLQSGKETTVELGDNNPRNTGVYTRRTGESAVWLLPRQQFSQIDRNLDQLREHQLGLLGDDDPQRITLEYRGGTVASLAKVDDGWQLEVPQQSPANPTTVGNFLNSLRFARASQFIDVPQEDWFDNPLVQISLQLSPLTTHTLTIGHAVPEENLYYARLNRDPEVVLLNKSLVDALTPDLQDLLAN